MLLNMSKIMVFPRTSEFVIAKAKLDDLNLEYKIINPPLEYENIAVACIVFEQEAYSGLIGKSDGAFIYSGCVDYRGQTLNKIESEIQEENYDSDVFGKAYIMVLSPCVADETKVRLTVHLSEDISHLLPYLNAYIHSAFYNDDSCSLTFMEQYRLITIYRSKIAIAKADDITDAWRIIAKIRSLVNTVNHNKATITPNYEMRKKPPALEIYNCLPKTNCGKCAQKTCMAFAFALHSGTADPFGCKPIFEGDYKHLIPKFTNILPRIGIPILED
jgi:ArsR family metal-binding transcriptional regulator